MKLGKVNILLVALATIILISSNYLAPINWFCSALIGEEWYTYSTSNQDFITQEMPDKGLSLKRVELSFKNYLDEHSGAVDTVLYRNFSRNPLKFWHWHEYLFHKRYNYPYMNLREIKGKE